MSDHTELLEAALNSLTEGIALLGEERHIVLWNQAAEAITGHAGPDLVGRPVPETLKPLLERCAPPMDAEPHTDPKPMRGFPVHVRHKLGHDVPAMARMLVLRDVLGGRIGTVIVFHPTESLDALPHGETGEDEGVKVSQADLKERLEAEFEDFARGGETFGVLWITVDQAHDLRKTHGANACDTMIQKVAQALAKGLRPTEKLGRWGDDEFLVVSHERTPEMLASHAQALAGLARTADFRWWGDRVSITVSIGAAQADQAGTLADLLGRAKAAMSSSFHAGGNQITSAPGVQACSPS
jgi:diguanylate cyclase (GGDEF)-like protein/PAS domain S-box-containing protein